MNIKGPKGRGAYSAIVYKDGDLNVSEDAVGTLISEGSNAATVINAAIDSLPSTGGLIFLNDKFTITSTITLDTDGIILMGDSWSGSGLDTTSDIPLITITSGGTKAIIEKLYLYGANDVAKTNNHGIFFSGSAVKYDHQLRDIFIEQTYDGINGTKITFDRWSNVHCYKQKHDGIHISGDGTDYCGINTINITLKEYAHNGMYFDYLMGSKIANTWVEGSSVGYRGVEMYHGYMNFFTNIDLENHTNDGMHIEDDNFGSTINGGWFAGNGVNGFTYVNAKQGAISQCYFRENQAMGIYIKDSARMSVVNCYAIDNSVTGANSYSGFTFENTTDSIIGNLHAYDTRGTKKQKYGIEELGTSDYNRYTNNNLRGNLTLGIYTVGAHNTYDLHLKSTSLDLSGAASDVEVLLAIAPCTLVGYQIFYTEASSADAGVNIRIGRYQNGVALDDDYFDVSTSEVSKSKGYSKFFKTSDLTQKVIAVGDVVTVGTAGGKTGTGEVSVILLISEQSD